MKTGARESPFEGMVEFYHEIADGRPLFRAVKDAAERYNKEAKRRIQEGVVVTPQT